MIMIEWIDSFRKKKIQFNLMSYLMRPFSISLRLFFGLIYTIKQWWYWPERKSFITHWPDWMSLSHHHHHPRHWLFDYHAIVSFCCIKPWWWSSLFIGKWLKIMMITLWKTKQKNNWIIIKQAHSGDSGRQWHILWCWNDAKKWKITQKKNRN